MKKILKVSLLLLVFLFYLTHFVIVSAIGFEAEKSFGSIFVVKTDKSIGSGFALGEKVIITNAHVVLGRSSVELESYENTVYYADVFLFDEELDIALIYVENGNFESLPVGESDSITIGDDVYAIGAPAGMSFTLTKGTVSSRKRKINNEQFIQIDAALNSGNSGGPLLDNTGKVIGMNTMKINNTEGLGLAIPIERILKYIKGNNIEISNNGIVLSKKYEFDEDSETDNDNIYQAYIQDVDSNSSKEKDVNITVALLCVSVMLNVIMVLIVLQCVSIVKKHKKSSEKTDFEIDIWE